MGGTWLEGAPSREQQVIRWPAVSAYPDLVAEAIEEAPREGTTYYIVEHVLERVLGNDLT
jgi:hypothetical protein